MLKLLRRVIPPDFFAGLVHPVYATFCIARDAEWSGRLFVIDLCDDDEEGIGTSIKVDHQAPAFPKNLYLEPDKIRKVQILT